MSDVTSLAGSLSSAKSTKRLSKREINRLFWTTSAQHSYAGRQLTAVDHNECFDQIHKVGHANTKYLKFPLNHAPTTQRSSCAYNTEFAPKPTDLIADNNDFAKTLKGGALQKSAPSLGTKTTHNDTYKWVDTAKEFKASKFPLEAAQGDSHASTCTLGAIGGSHIKASHMHSQHRGQPKDHKMMGTLPYPKSNLMLSGGQYSHWTTKYEHEAQFCEGNSGVLPPAPGPQCPHGKGGSRTAVGGPPKPQHIRLGLPPSVPT